MTARRMYTFGMITFFVSGMLMLLRDLLSSQASGSQGSRSNLTFVSFCVVMAIAFWLLRRALPPK